MRDKEKGLRGSRRGQRLLLHERVAGKTMLAGGAHGSAAGRAASGLSGRRGRADGVGRGPCASGAREFGPVRVRLGRDCAGVGWTGWEAGCWAGFSSSNKSI